MLMIVFGDKSLCRLVAKRCRAGTSRACGPSFAKAGRITACQDAGTEPSLHGVFPNGGLAGRGFLYLTAPAAHDFAPRRGDTLYESSNIGDQVHCKQVSECLVSERSPRT